MPSLPLWTALPHTLDALLARMVDVRLYPVVPGEGRARCDTRLLGDKAPDPHDWRLWRTGSFLADYANELQTWPVYLRRCTACAAVEVRKEGWRGTVWSARSVGIKRTPGPADVLLGWYQG